MTAALAALTAAGGTAGVGAGLGGMFGLFGKKKKQDENQFSEYLSPEYLKLRDMLYGVANQGYPELATQGQEYYQNTLMPQIREQYETKRNPWNKGFADTPEAYQFAQAGRGVATDVAQQNIQARMNALNMLRGITPSPMTTYEQPYEPLQDLLSGGLGLGSNLLGSYLGTQWQGQANKDFLKELAQYKDFFKGTP